MIHRRSYQNVLNALGRQAAVALLGSRQVGKTTLALEIAESAGAIYLDLESRADREKLAEPALYLDEYEDRLVILDEDSPRPGIVPGTARTDRPGPQAGKADGPLPGAGFGLAGPAPAIGGEPRRANRIRRTRPARRKRSRARRAGHDVAMGARWFPGQLPGRQRPRQHDLPAEFRPVPIWSAT